MGLLPDSIRSTLSARADKHVGLEAAAWYWHFVDVVWLFLFAWVYWWGSYRAFAEH